jgi:hypothetical protein
MLLQKPCASVICKRNKKRALLQAPFKFLGRKAYLVAFSSTFLVVSAAAAFEVSTEAASSVLTEVSAVLLAVSASAVPLLPEQAAKANIAQAAIAK